MPTEAYLSDVATLAERLLAGYYLGSDLYTAVELAAESRELSVSVYAATSFTRPGLAGLGALQMVLEAAAVAAEYVDERHYSGGEVESRLLYELAIDPAISIEFDALEAGTVFGKLKILKKRGPRSLLIAVASLAGVGLAITGVGLPLMIIGGVAPTIEYFLSRGEHRTEGKESAQVAELERKVDELKADKRRQGEEIESLRNERSRAEVADADREQLRLAQLAAAERDRLRIDQLERAIRAIAEREGGKVARLNTVEQNELEAAEIRTLLIESIAA